MKSPTYTIVIATADWHIVRTSPRDFDCFVTGRGYIGTRPSRLEAEQLIADYRYNTLARAA